MKRNSPSEDTKFLNRALGIYESIVHSEGLVDRTGPKTFEDESLSRGDPGARPRLTDKNLESRTDYAESDSPVFARIPNGYDPATISLWDDLESVYTYNGRHMEALKQRAEWFVKPEWPTYVAWWVEDGKTPTREDAARRLEHLHDRNSDPHAFDLKTPFNAERLHGRWTVKNSRQGKNGESVQREQSRRLLRSSTLVRSA